MLRAPQYREPASRSVAVIRSRTRPISRRWKRKSAQQTRTQRQGSERSASLWLRARPPVRQGIRRSVEASRVRTPEQIKPSPCRSGLRADHRRARPRPDHRTAALRRREGGGRTPRPPVGPTCPGGAGPVAAADAERWIPADGRRRAVTCMRTRWQGGNGAARHGRFRHDPAGRGE